MTGLAHRPYLRMNGLGNEILVLDLRGSRLEVSAASARAIGAAEGLHFDQLMVLNDPRTGGTEAFVTIFNIDGSQARACGNGMRCVAWALMREGAAAQVSTETVAGILKCRKLAPLEFSVDMGRPSFAWRDLPLANDPGDMNHIAAARLGSLPSDVPPFSALAIGNPHAVFFGDAALGGRIGALGPLIETAPFFPDRVNVSFAHIVARDHIRLDVWERGAGRTRACGSAACATLIAAARLDLTDRCARVTLPGGDLRIEWCPDGGVTLAGAVELEREGRFDPRIFAGLTT